MKQIAPCPRCTCLAELKRQHGVWHAICGTCGAVPWRAVFRKHPPAVRYI